MTRRSRTLVLGALTLALGGGAHAQADDAGPRIVAADHYVDLRADELVVDSTWVIVDSTAEGESITLTPPLPTGATLSAEGWRTDYTDQRATRLVAQRAMPHGARVHLRTTLPRDIALALPRLPIPTVEGDAIQRVRFASSARFEVGEQTSLDVGAGIQVGRGIRQHIRRAADRALDGRHAHRRLGALYVRVEALGLEGQLRSAHEERRSLGWWAAGVFVLAAVGTYGVYRRAQRAVAGERVDAYLAQICADDEARALGVAVAQERAHEPPTPT
ncbi:MAG: hypothetical protein R3B40_07920 [Polyangiales bacterium]